MKKALRYTWYAFLAIFFLAIMARIFIFESSEVLIDIVPTDNAKEVYAEGGELLTHKILQEVSSDGFVRVYSFVWIPEKSEVQLTVKYNFAIFQKTPLNSPEDMAFKLYNTETEAEYKSVYREESQKGLYGFARLVFEGVRFDEDSDDLELITTNADGTEAYSAFKVHWAEFERGFKNYKLSKDEKALLEG